MNEAIELKGIRTHNLKNIDVRILHRSLVVITGVSGSGKSSLAFDTLYAEGRRRYVESLSTYARQFLERVEKPDLDFASGILPSIAIEAKNVVTQARSTVGTQTEIYDYLRLLFARIGKQYCTACGKPVEADDAASIFKKLESSSSERESIVAFPLAIGKKVSLTGLLEELERQGFLKVIEHGRAVDLRQVKKSAFKAAGGLLVVVDQLTLSDANRPRLIDSIEQALRYGKGKVSIFVERGGSPIEEKFSNRFHCARCDLEYRLLSANAFSFNSPLGACPACQGFGRVITIDWNLVIPNPNLSIEAGAIEPWTKPSAAWEFKQLKAFCRRRNIPMDVPFSKLAKTVQDQIIQGTDADRDYFSVTDFFEYLEKKTYKMHVRIFLSKYRGYVPCTACGAKRLRPEALSVKLQGMNIADLTALTVKALIAFFEGLTLSDHDGKVAEPLLFEINRRLRFLEEVGLGYLTLERLSRTLSGGEAQRIHLAASLGSALVDTLYVLDEPSVGLHERDNVLLIRLLKELRGLGNTVVVVEHDRTMIESADHLIDLGPLGGERGGEITYAGDFQNLSLASNSETARYFRGELFIERAGEMRNAAASAIQIHGAAQHNLKHISVSIPLGQLVVITGVSGSGKSTLLYDVLFHNYLRFRGRPVQEVGRVERITGWQHIQDMVLVDQSPIGRTPRSNPVTYVKAFDSIRKAFARTREARMRRLTPGHFSFNVPGGRCERCEGGGTVKVEMHFLADIAMTCEMCNGSRYQSKILEIHLRGKNMKDVLEMTVDEAIEFFRDHPEVTQKLRVLSQVGLGYLRLGQSATTLSGGEAQRLKLASEITERRGENLLYLFDEPTTGLHYYDISRLVGAFDILLARGHSLCVIEHNMEIIKCADYVIDLGPEGGAEGGEVIYEGALPGLVEANRSHTAAALKNYLRKIKQKVTRAI